MNILEFENIITSHIKIRYNFNEELNKIYINSFFWNSKNEDEIIFFAIKGLNEDGNKYIEDAIKNGYLIIISDNEEYINIIKDRFLNIYFIIVDNIQNTLNTLGKFGINNFHGMKFAITGSVGKTTSTYLLNNILKEFYNPIATHKYNSQYYLRRLCFSLFEKNNNVLVTELSSDSMGMINNFGDIIKPDYSIITAIGNAHMEDFKSIQNTIKEKTSLIVHTKYKCFIPIEYKEMIKNEPNVINNIDKIIFVENNFSINNNSITYNIHNHKIIINNPSLTGVYNYSNINLILHLLYEFNSQLLLNMDNQNKIIKSIASLNPFPGRGNIIEIKKNDFKFKITCEYHNANLLSFKETVKNIKEPTIILMGYMYSLGDETINSHEEILNIIEEHPYIENVILCDKKIYKIGFILNKYTKILPAYEDVLYNLCTNKYTNVKNIFIKGSRSSKLEIFVKKLLDFCE